MTANRSSAHRAIQHPLTSATTKNASHAMLALVAVAAALGSVGCDSKLEREDAMRLIQSMDAYQPNGKRCTVTLLRDGGTWYHSTIVPADRTCVTQLSNAGLVSVGECTDTRCTSGCCGRAVSPVGVAEVIGQRLTFPCGQNRVTDITSISTSDDGRSAEIRYTYERSLDNALLQSLSSCEVNSGGSELTGSQQRTATRDDSGTWVLDER